jgi:hypothetical protein
MTPCTRAGAHIVLTRSELALIEFFLTTPPLARGAQASLPLQSSYGRRSEAYFAVVSFRRQTGVSKQGPFISAKYFHLVVQILPLSGFAPFGDPIVKIYLDAPYMPGSRQIW